MALHPLAAGFADVADAYDRGRPEYAPAVVGAIAAELQVPSGGRVLDLAAGTGKLARALLAGGLDVVAVEPQAPLREILATSIGAGRVREGTAEAIPLPDGSVAAVTVADAMHWFDQVAALTEIRRVLRLGGGLAVLTTVPDWGSASWAHEVGSLIGDMRPQHPHFDGPPWQDALAAADGWGPAREIRLTSSQPLQRERFIDYAASISWVAALPQQLRAEKLAQIAALVEAGDTPSELPVNVVVGLAAAR
ncbi:MAG TPA: class I SAM-dependent methyltransferase [Solirubrobacteraceae bacterium]|jgi:SAM-dependent methyltransferase|nr:class I SAM-dependent methyltransferase [Solirubrobacteraceae bacterium]